MRVNRPHFRDGDWNVICDVCGFEYKASEVKKRWDGLMVCQKDWEIRQPMDHARIPRSEKNRVTFIRPEPTHRFLAVGEATAEKL